MPNDLVFITGVSGHVGFAILRETLAQGYRVRAAIRKAQQEELIRSKKSIQKFSSQLEFVVVPDLQAESPFLSHLSGVKFIIHVASPLPFQTEHLVRDIVEPAVVCTTRILEDANKAESVKRLVITSSMNALIEPEFADGNTTDRVFDNQSIFDWGNREISNFRLAYRAGKNKALHKTNEFVKQHTPSFDVINIMPSFVIGKNELVTTTTEILHGSNGLVLCGLLGMDNRGRSVGATVHLDDVAIAHVNSLDLNIKGNRNFLMTSGGIDGNQLADAIAIGKEKFPGSFERTFPEASSDCMQTFTIKIDASETEDVLGFRYKPYDEQVQSIIEQYIELAKVESDKE